MTNINGLPIFTLKYTKQNFVNNIHQTHNYKTMLPKPTKISQYKLNQSQEKLDVVEVTLSSWDWGGHTGL